MIRTPPRPPIRADRILIALALGPLLCWLPLLVLDSIQSQRQRPRKAQPPAAIRPSAAAPPRAARPSPRNPSNRSATARTLARTGPAAPPAGSRARPKARLAAAPATASKRPVVVPKAKRPTASRPGIQVAQRQPRPRKRQRQPGAAPLAPAILSSIKPKAPSGAMLLGNLDLSSLAEKPMLTAARLERSRQLAAPDPLSVVPKALKPTFRATIPQGERVIPAEIVRLPAPHLQTTEQFPLLLLPNGRVQGPTTFRSAASQQRVESWLARQPAVASGSVRPVLLKLEPLAPASPLPAARTRHGDRRPPRVR